ncbi:hypothetical protein [Sphingobacterium sp. MYb388]|uniref:hypothetical protein n=1 Tax=Sphingobacterium sp. MYb388 TaxID=2745437 RepID=UPI003097F7D9
MFLLAAISSFLITFYTTELSVPWSLTLRKHMLIFLFSFILMVLAIFPTGYVVYRLDTDSFMRQHELLRYLIQFLLLVMLMGALALRVVYELYLALFGVDLQKAEYFERDFVVVIFCLIMVQVYYFIRKERKVSAYTFKRNQIMKMWLLHREESIDEIGSGKVLLLQELKESRAQQESLRILHEKQLDELSVERDKLIKFYEDDLQELRARKQHLRSSHELLSMDEMRLKICLKELSDEVLVIIGAENEYVRIPQIAYFHLKEGSSRFKLVDVLLLDGREGKVDLESLAKIEKLWPNLLFRAGRGLLIMHLAIRTLLKEGDMYFIVFYGATQEKYKLQVDVYKKLLKTRAEWTKLMPERQ